jgi:RNA 2',3'-cyclic 3'-phosphodiesterase
MRVFIAIDIPEEIQVRLAAVQEQLRPVSASARWVAVESIHLTLRFIGEISENHLEDIDNALGGLTWKPFPVVVRGVGFFPGARSPRVLWAGLEPSTMEGLAKEIDSRLERAGFDHEKRAFRAHLTLARSRGTRLDGALVTAAAELAETEFGTFVADRCFLYQSTLKTRGAIYTKLKEYLL